MHCRRKTNSPCNSLPGINVETRWAVKSVAFDEINCHIRLGDQLSHLTRRSTVTSDSEINCHIWLGRSWVGFLLLWQKQGFPTSPHFSLELKVSECRDNPGGSLPIMCVAHQCTPLFPKNPLQLVTAILNPHPLRQGISNHQPLWQDNFQSPPQMTGRLT
jgi:hypothetical protein